MKRSLLPILLLTLPFVAPAGAQAPAEQAAAADVAAARQFFEVIEAGDPARIEAFAASAFAPGAARFEAPADTLARMRTLAEQSGGIELREWTVRGDQIRFAGITRRGAIPVRGIVGTENGKLLGFNIGRDMRHRGPEAPAWPSAAASADEALAAVERELEWRASADIFSGAVLIAYRGRPVLERAWGLAGRDPAQPNRVETPFHTASTTKMLTAAALGRLVDQGRLSLDMSVAQAVPALAASPGAADVRLRDLLGHRVSYGDYILSDEYRAMEREGLSATELLALIVGRAPEPAAAGRIRYSNANYLVLAGAIEAASGMNYYDFVEAQVLRPNGMSSTRFGNPRTRPQAAAIGWIKDDATDPLGTGPWRPNDGIVPLRGGPPGGTWSSAGDMWRFIDGLAAGRLVAPATLAAMLQDRRTMGRGFDYALGFQVGNVAGRTYFGHDGGGGNAGVSTSVFTTGDRTWSVVVLSNYSSPAGDALGQTIMELLLTVPAEAADAAP